MRLARNVELAIKKGVGPQVRSGAQRGFTARDGGLLSQSFKPSSQTSTWNRSNRDSSYSPKQDRRVAGAASETPKQPVSGARGIRHLTTQEWEERRKKGLCFRCGMPYNPLHKCADPKVRVVLLGEDEMTNEEGEVLVAEEMNPEIEDDLEEGECRMLEYLDMAELFQTQENRGELSSMKVEGQVGGIPILILLDSGATHNFISPKLGVCQKLKVDIGGYGCLIDAYVLDIGGLDLILGVAWLRMLGDVIANWEKVTMSFQVSGQNFILEGAVKPNQVVSSLHSITHNPYFGSIQPDRKKGNREVSGTQTLTIQQQQQLQHLLSTLEVVFQEPSGLPPRRSFDHGIQLVQGQGAISEVANDETLEPIKSGDKKVKAWRVYYRKRKGVTRGEDIGEKSSAVLAAHGLSCSVLAFVAGFEASNIDQQSHEFFIVDKTSCKLQALTNKNHFSLKRRYRTWNIGYKDREVLNVCNYAVSGAVRLHNKKIPSKVTKNALLLIFNTLIKWMHIHFRIPSYFFKVRQFIGSELFVHNGDSRSGVDISVLSGFHLTLNICLQLKNVPPNLHVNPTKLYCILHCNTSFQVPAGQTLENSPTGYQVWKDDEIVELNKKLFCHVSDYMTDKRRIGMHNKGDDGNSRAVEAFLHFEPNEKGQGFSYCYLMYLTFLWVLIESNGIAVWLIVRAPIGASSL
ncbi:Aspartic peptidase domain superfamily [Sesbania bispinosa]|nr:Aspartic peptidase domain superfamily [Sesbania bispinosa]